MTHGMRGVALALAALVLPAVEAEPSPASELDAGFADPPQSAGIRCFWWWLNGNVTQEAITRDLEEMRAKGFSGALIFDADGSSQGGHTRVPAGPLFGSPEWTARFAHACREAHRLGLELSLSIQSGWNLGGPDVTPDESAHRLAWSEARARGPGPFTGRLAQPPARDGCYRDVAVVAVPLAAAASGASWEMKASAGQAEIPPARMVDGNAATCWVSAEGPTPERPVTVTFAFREPASVGGVTLLGRPGYGPRRCELQESQDGRTFRKVKAFDVADGTEATVRFDARRTAALRVLVTGGYDPRSPDAPRNVQIAEIALLDGDGRPLGAAARAPIRDLTKKALFQELGGSAPDCRPLLFDDPGAGNEADARAADVVVLTDRLRPDGTMAWSVPEGEWRVFRFGRVPTGAHVSTASGAWQGRVIDYMSEQALRAYWDRSVEPLLKAIGPLAGKTLRYLHTDSWECGGMNWTEGFERAFRERRGYDPLPWLPVIAGCIVESRDASNAFLADFRKTISDCVADRHYARFAALARERGLAIHPESAGPHAGPLDGLKNYGRSELMMSEAWVPSPHRPTPSARFFVKQAASAAHIYGKRLVGAEIFTSIGPHWDDVLWAAQKPTFDHELCDGLNLAFVHTFTCSPTNMGLPGQEYFAGTHFNPNVTWWPYAGAFTRYLARCQFVVQQGRFVADVLYYYGDHVPNIARRKGDDPAGALPGFDYDVINEELLPKLSVQDGRLALPSGMRYRLLALPDHRVLSLKALREASRLVAAGATVLGPKPIRAVSLEGGAEGAAEFQRLADALWGAGDPAARGSRAAGAGRVLWGMAAREALLADGLKPDCAFADTAEGAELDWIHYTIGDADVFFVCNQRARVERFTARFRVTGRHPELWDAVDGSIRDAATFTFEDGTTVLPLELPPHGSRFVVLRKPAAEGRRDGPNATPWREVQPVAGPWEVRFDPAWGAPASARFDALVSWTERPEEGIRFYSGTAVYRTAFDLKKAAPAGARLALDLGEVKDTGIARVRLNGQDLGILWCPPFRVDITRAVKTAGNTLEVEVTNSWRNRLVGDRDRPPDQRLTKTNIAIRKEWKPVASGLLGPVRLLAAE